MVFAGKLKDGIVERKFTPEDFNPPTNYNGKWLYKDSIQNILIHLQKINDKAYKGKIERNYDTKQRIEKTLNTNSKGDTNAMK